MLIKRVTPAKSASFPSIIRRAVLIAEDSIIFGEGTSFRGQAISGRKLKVAGGLIDYPSFLFVYGSKLSDSSYLEFTSGAKSRTIAMIDGVNEENPNKFAMMQIDTNSMVTGVAYSGQYSEIKGTLD